MKAWLEVVIVDGGCPREIEPGCRKETFYLLQVIVLQPRMNLAAHLVPSYTPKDS